MRRLHKPMLLVFVTVFCSTVYAQTPSPAAYFSCGNAPFSASALATVTVLGKGRLFFVRDDQDCPNNTAACREKAYVIPGDTLLTAQTAGDYVCAFFPNAKDGHTGWLRKNRLAQVSAPLPTTTWDGRWAMDDNVITLSHRDQWVHADGEAYYPMADPPLEQFPGGPNLGAMGGSAQPRGHRVKFTEEGCSVVAMLVGKFLVVSDNHECGGLNVRFNGIYQRQ